MDVKITNNKEGLSKSTQIRDGSSAESSKKVFRGLWIFQDKLGREGIQLKRHKFKTDMFLHGREIFKEDSSTFYVHSRFTYKTEDERGWLDADSCT